MAGCLGRDEEENTGTFRTPLQDKYQSPAAGAAKSPGGEWQGHPSPDGDEQSTTGVGAGGQASDTAQARNPGPLGGGTSAPNDERPMEGTGGSGRGIAPRDGLGVGLAESYDAAPPPQGVNEATDGAGGQGLRGTPAQGMQGPQGPGQGEGIQGQGQQGEGQQGDQGPQRNQGGQ
jgi:hypothetical protein